MKLRKWLAVSLAAALALSAVHGQYRIVSAEEAGEETVTAEAENLNAEEAAGENQPQDMEDGEILENRSSEDGDLSDNTQSVEKNPDTGNGQNSGNNQDAENGQNSGNNQSAEKDQNFGNNQSAEKDQNFRNDQNAEKDQNFGNDQDTENKQGSEEKEEMETGESGVDLPAETPGNSAVTDTPASDLAAEEHEQDDPAGSEGDGEASDETALPEEKGLLKTEEPAADEASVENGMLESAGDPAAQAGDIASGTDGNINWRIDADGKLTVSGTGDFTLDSPELFPWWRYWEQIISAEVHIIGMTNASHMFASCSNLSILDLSGFDTSNVTDMSDMFAGCDSLSSLDLSNFNTSNVTNMSSMFAGCDSLSSLNLSDFDTSNVTDMGQMFYSCDSLGSLEISSFDTSNVTNMNSMFGFCRNLSSLEISNFDTSNVTNMNNMFEFCNNLSSLEISNFNTSNVTDMGDMFIACASLSSLGVSNFDTSNVTDMSGMFGSCSSLNSLDLSNFDTVNVTDMSDMFNSCNSLENLDLSNFNTTNVTNMNGMFYGCSNLSSLDLSNFDTVNVTDMSEMFNSCNSLENLDLSNFNTTNVTNMNVMFYGCSSLETLDLSNFDIANVTYFIWDVFDGCSNLTEIHSPYNINCVVELPTGPDILWLLPDGTEVTELPQNLPQSVTITRRRNPKIITTTPDLNMSDVVRVKYVPYSYTVETNNWEEDNIVTYSLAGGELAEGLMLYPATGEIYGIPLEAGEFPITVKAEFSNPEYLPSYADLTVTVLDNTDGNVSIASDPGYEVEQYLGTQLNGADGIYYAVQERNDQLFVSAGENGEFIDLWLNGVKLTENEDYTRESGSTRITVRSQTLENKTNKDGVNTIAAEFRVGGDRSNDLKRTAQNFRIDFQQGGGSGDDFQQGGSSGGGSRSGRGGSGGGSPEEGVVSVSSATAVVRLVNAAGNPLTGAVLELHSTPQTAQTDRRGTAVFAGVTAGLHTLYVKDGAGNILASRNFELLFGDKVLVNADQVTAKAGGVFTVQVQMKEKELAFLSAQEGDVYRVASAGTGDETEPGLWLLLLLLSGGLSYGLCAGYRKRRMY